MNLQALLNPRFWKRKPVAPYEDVHFEAAPAPGLDDLRARLNRWGHLWSADNDSTAGSDAERLVTERLTRWMERCFGQHVPNSLRGKGDSISLASSMPILTAFLGRRATRELSRRVLQDI